MVEHLIYTEQVMSSSLIPPMKKGMVAERLNAADCKSVPREGSLVQIQSSPVNKSMSKNRYGRNKERRARGDWQSSRWHKVEARQNHRRRHFVRGKPLQAGEEANKGRSGGIYGCGASRATERCRSFSVSERARVGKRSAGVMVAIERTMKHSIVMGPERKRKEREARKREQVRGTVRGRKMKRGLPVRGQRTCTNGKTARRLNSKRISG
jgi:small subunit ribosomal protein S13